MIPLSRGLAPLHLHETEKPKQQRPYNSREQFSALCGHSDGLINTNHEVKGKRCDLKSAAEHYTNLPDIDSFQALAKHLNLSIYNPDGVASYPDISLKHQLCCPVKCVSALRIGTIYLGFKIKNISPFISDEINHTSAKHPHIAAMCRFYEQLHQISSPGKIYIANYGYLKGLFSNDGHIYIFNTNEYETALKARPPYNEKVAARSTCNTCLGSNLISY